MSTPITAINFLNKAFEEQLYHNIAMHGYYKDDKESYDVILEEINEVKDACKDFEKADKLLFFLKEKNLVEIKALSFHLLEECMHVISAIDKINESE